MHKKRPNRSCRQKRPSRHLFFPSNLSVHIDAQYKFAAQLTLVSPFLFLFLFFLFSLLFLQLSTPFFFFWLNPPLLTPHHHRQHTSIMVSSQHTTSVSTQATWVCSNIISFLSKNKNPQATWEREMLIARGPHFFLLF